MKNIKRLTAIMILAAVATIGTPQAFAGASESPGKAGIMLGDRTGIMLGDRTGIMLGDVTGIMLGDVAGIMLGD